MNISQYHKYQNLRNITIDDLSRKIFRIIPVSYLEHMLSTSTNTLTKTKSWEDVYENFFFKQNFTTIDNLHVTLEYLEKVVYGQCWSLNRDSDAMWRIYSQNKESVRIQTTIGKLFDSVYLGDSCLSTTYIGSVNYMTKEAIEEWLIENNPVSDVGAIINKSLFIKRDNFNHENEVRVIYNPSTEEDESYKLLKSYKIDINDFIEEIAFDPRVDDSFMKKTEQMIRKFNVPLDHVSKSHLYDFRPIDIKLA